MELLTVREYISQFVNYQVQSGADKLLSYAKAYLGHDLGYSYTESQSKLGINHVTAFCTKGRVKQDIINMAKKYLTLIAIDDLVLFSREQGLAVISARRKDKIDYDNGFWQWEGDYITYMDDLIREAELGLRLEDFPPKNSTTKKYSISDIPGYLFETETLEDGTTKYISYVKKTPELLKAAGLADLEDDDDILTGSVYDKQTENKYAQSNLKSIGWPYLSGPIMDEE